MVEESCTHDLSFCLTCDGEEGNPNSKNEDKDHAKYGQNAGNSLVDVGKVEGSKSHEGHDGQLEIHLDHESKRKVELEASE